MRIKEIFRSIQGEGANMGLPFIFIRFSGCNKNCPWCDTDWKGGTEMSVEEIVREVRRLAGEDKYIRILFTGGEPLLQLNTELIEAISSEFMFTFFALETNGVTKWKEDSLINIDHITISPKGPPEEMKIDFGWVHELKLLVGDDGIVFGTMEEWIELIEEEGTPPHSLIVMPIEIDGKLTGVQNCIDLVNDNSGWKLGIQAHKVWGVK